MLDSSFSGDGCLFVDNLKLGMLDAILCFTLFGNCIHLNAIAINQCGINLLE